MLGDGWLVGLVRLVGLILVVRLEVMSLLLRLCLPVPSSYASAGRSRLLRLVELVELLLRLTPLLHLLLLLLRRLTPMSLILPPPLRAPLRSKAGQLRQRTSSRRARARQELLPQAGTPRRHVIVVRW